METDLYKARSVQACFSAAYDLFTSNIKTIIKKTWKTTLLLSALISLYQIVLTNNSISLQTGIHSAHKTITYAATTITAAIACMVTSVWFYATIISLLNGRKRKENGMRILRATLLYIGMFTMLLIATILLAGLAATLSLDKHSGGLPLPMVSSILTTLILFIAWCIITLPTAYSCMKYIMEPNLKVGSILGKPYRQGWRHWGFLFVCTLLTCIITWIGGFIAQSPSYIMMIALAVSKSGEAIGDISGLPAQFFPTFYVINTLCTFVWCHIVIWVVMVYYYAYGSIETKNKETTQATI